jgi:AraC-like DNA-binding protein
MPDPWSAVYPREVNRFADFTTYRETMGTRNPPVLLRPLDTERDDPEAPFTGAFWNTRAGQLNSSENVGDSLTFTRSKSLIAGSQLDGYQFFLQMEGGWHLAQAGHERLIEPGTVVLLDLNEPFRSVKRGRWRHRAISVPRAAIDPWIPPDWRRGGLVCGGGLGKVIAAYARALTDEIASLTPPEGSAGLHHLCQLFALNAADTSDRRAMTREALRAAKLAQVRRYIERHLGDDLSVARVAAANALSERALHLLFEPSGTSFAAYVQSRRLEKCHTLLSDEAFAGRPISEIAFACGFNSLATFYRAFQRAFGAAPGDVRVAAGHG